MAEQIKDETSWGGQSSLDEISISYLKSDFSLSGAYEIAWRLFVLQGKEDHYNS